MLDSCRKSELGCAAEPVSMNSDTMVAAGKNSALAAIDQFDGESGSQTDLAIAVRKYLRRRP